MPLRQPGKQGCKGRPALCRGWQGCPLLFLLFLCAAAGGAQEVKKVFRRTPPSPGRGTPLHPGVRISVSMFRDNSWKQDGRHMLEKPSRLKEPRAREGWFSIHESSILVR